MTRFQITVDCADPIGMAVFWAEALGYGLQSPPGQFDSWRDYWISVGVPEDEVEDGVDAIVDPDEAGPRVWFQQVPERKSIKNRLHFDVLVGGGRSIPLADRKERVLVEVARLVELGASEVRVMDNSEIDHFAVAMVDPEGNEFDIV